MLSMGIQYQPYTVIPTVLGSDFGFWVTCGVKMMSLCHDWGWQPHLKLLPTSISDIYKVFGHVYMLSMGCPWAYSISLTQLYPPYLAQILGLWVTCGVIIMSLCHGWGWQPPQTVSHIHIRHLKSVWARWYAIHRHMVAALHIYPTLLGSDFGAFGH
jgi:hypothetical protein